MAERARRRQQRALDVSQTESRKGANNAYRREPRPGPHTYIITAVIFREQSRTIAGSCDTTDVANSWRVTTQKAEKARTYSQYGGKSHECQMRRAVVNNMHAGTADAYRCVT